MTPLEQLWADQHDNDRTPADEAFEAFLGGCAIRTVLDDREPTTEIERRHLDRARQAAA